MILDSLFKNIAALGFVGHMPFAPGTAGTLAGLIILALLKPSLPFHIALTLFLFIIGAVAADYAEKLSKQKDPAYIVIDEFAGYMASLLFLPLQWEYMTAAFILFRIFDIIKPPPIKKIEHVFKGGLGIMADDIAAAVYTNLLLQAWRLLN